MKSHNRRERVEEVAARIGNVIDREPGDKPPRQTPTERSWRMHRYHHLPSVHPNCTCSLDNAGNWQFGTSASGTCRICRDARRKYNRRRRSRIAAALLKKHTSAAQDYT